MTTTTIKGAIVTIILTKENSGIDLEKKGEGYGEVKINLKWNSTPAKKGLFGLFGGGHAEAVDLDLGCLFEMKDGTKGAIQALGNAFGQLNRAPFIALDGDDRTGESADGEWLRINGAQWDQIKRVLIYTFIYDGVPNWAATNGVVTVYAPDAQPVQVALDEAQGGLSMCAIATIVNDNGKMRVQREVKYFKGHEPMDRAFGWGMHWVAGRK